MRWPPVAVTPWGMQNDVIHNGFAAALLMLLFAGLGQAKAAEVAPPVPAAQVAAAADTAPPVVGLSTWLSAPAQ